MPIRWYGSGDPNDPLYKHFSRVVNLTLHAMAFAALNSGLWFWQQIRQPWEHLDWFSEIWLTGLLLHLVIVVLARPASSGPDSPSLDQE